jgi:hypothetical protein
MPQPPFAELGPVHADKVISAKPEEACFLRVIVAPFRRQREAPFGAAYEPAHAAGLVEHGLGYDAVERFPRCRGGRPLGRAASDWTGLSGRAASAGPDGRTGPGVGWAAVSDEEAPGRARRSGGRRANQLIFMSARSRPALAARASTKPGIAQAASSWQLWEGPAASAGQGASVVQGAITRQPLAHRASRRAIASRAAARVAGSIISTLPPSAKRPAARSTRAARSSTRPLSPAWNSLRLCPKHMSSKRLAV